MRRNECFDQQLKLAIQAFDKHVLINTEDRRWEIAKRSPDGHIEGSYRTEIISLIGGRLFVGGDIDDCVFAYYSDTANVYNKLAWIGRCSDVEYYILQKAQIGLNDNGALTKQYDDYLAREQLQAQWNDDKKDLADQPERLERCNESFERLLDVVTNTTNQVELLNTANHDDFLQETDAWEWLANIGMTCSSRVIYAWAATRKLCDLLSIP